MATPNKHCWYELITTDKAAAEAFYRDVVGWGIVDSGIAGMEYAILHAQEHPIGGMMAMANMPPLWFGYVAVDDVDAYVRKVEALGGRLHVGPDDIPEVGRFAVVADPQGASFVLFKGNGSPDPAPLPYMSNGTVGWNELHSSDWENAFAFYAALFGWAKDQPMDMGPMGTYQLFSTGNHAVGAMFNADDTPKSMWLYYFAVADIDAARAKVEAGGGRVTVEPMEVPGGMWVINATDPQGELFALVGPRA